jgi:hypothetical protein
LSENEIYPKLNLDSSKWVQTVDPIQRQIPITFVVRTLVNSTKGNIFVPLPVPVGILNAVIIVVPLETRENGVFIVKTEPVSTTAVTLEPTLEAVVVMAVAALWAAGLPVVDKALPGIRWPAAFRISGVNWRVISQLSIAIVTTEPPSTRSALNREVAENEPVLRSIEILAPMPARNNWLTTAPGISKQI